MPDAERSNVWSRRDVLKAGGVGAGLALLLASDSGAQVSRGYGPVGPSNLPELLLPAGFTARELAVTGQVVPGTTFRWHGAPDHGECFALPDGGWVYVSNSEIDRGRGGVSALRFDRQGAVVSAYTIASGTSRNCGGGATSWGTWLSGEEVERGLVIECDPTSPGSGIRRPALGAFVHESTAEDPISGDIYQTEDHPLGRLYRFRPTSRGDLSAGTLQAAALVGAPPPSGATVWGTVTWIDVSPGGPSRDPATLAFNGGEGIIVDGPTIFFVTKGDHRIWRLDLPTSQLSVFYDGVATPSALRGLDQVIVHPSTRELFVVEDGGDMQVVHGSMNADGSAAAWAPFAQFVGHAGSEVTGPAFSPDGLRLYVSSQRGTDGATGRTYEIRGPFGGGVGLASVSRRWTARRALPAQPFG